MSALCRKVARGASQSGRLTLACPQNCKTVSESGETAVLDVREPVQPSDHYSGGLQRRAVRLLADLILKVVVIACPTFPVTLRCGESRRLPSKDVVRDPRIRLLRGARRRAWERGPT